MHQEAVKLRIDQSNATSDGLSLGNGLYGQTFTPKAKNLAQVDVRLTVNQLTADLPTTLGLYTTITGSPIATATATVAAHAPGELSRVISYRFEPPVTLARGTAYIIGMQVPSSLSWEFTYSDPYGGGQVILFDGTPLNPTADFVFTTYELK